MIRAFIDSSVFIAACFSASGASREIIHHALREQVTLIASQLVLDETERNITSKAPEALPFFQQLIDTLPLELVRPSKREVQQAAQYTALKDAPIVAAARKANVDYLASLDQRHLVGISEVVQGSGLSIVLPAELLHAIREEIGYI